MKKENSIWISGAALLLSVMAILVALYPDKTGNVSFREIMEISVATTSIGVTVLLGVQIFTIISIDKKIDDAVEKAKGELKNENSVLRKQLERYTIAIQKYTSGNICIANNQYGDAFCAFCLAAIEGKALNDNKLLSESLFQAMELLKYKEQIMNNPIVNENLNMILDGMLNIPDERASYIFNLLTTETKKQKPITNPGNADFCQTRL